MTTIFSFFNSLIDIVNMLWDISPIVFVLCLVILLIGAFVLYAEIHEFSVNPGLHPKNHRQEAEDWVKSFPRFNRID